MSKGTKTPPNTNSERYIIKNLVEGLIIKLNNYLITNEQTHRYNMDWTKGTGYIEDGYGNRSKHYYKLEVYITENDGSIINVYGDNHAIPDGMSQLRILEAELQAYKNFLLHGIGSLISIQHSTFLQAEASQRNAELAEKKDVSNLIL